MKIIILIISLLVPTILFAETSGTTLTIVDCVPNTSYTVSINNSFEVSDASITTPDTLSYGSLVQVAYQGSSNGNTYHWVIQLDLASSPNTYYIDMGFNWDDLPDYNSQTTTSINSACYFNFMDFYSSMLGLSAHHVQNMNNFEFASSLSNITYQIQYEYGEMNNDFYMILLPAAAGSPTASHMTGKLTSNNADV